MSACSTGNGCASGSIRCALRHSRTTAAVVGVDSSNLEFDQAWSIRDDSWLCIHAKGEDPCRKLVARLNAALAEAYQDFDNTREIMILINE